MEEMVGTCATSWFFGEDSAGRSTAREEGKRKTERKKCYRVGYWKQVMRTWIMHNSRSWHKSRQVGVNGEREPAHRAEYNSSSSSSSNDHMAS